MPRRQEIPEQLRHGPVTIAYAESLGFSRQWLRGPNWRRIGCGTYVWAGIELDSHSELGALQRRLPRGSVFSGLTAARLHGMDTDGSAPVEVTVAPGVSLRARPGITVHAVALDPSAMTTCGALAVTTPVRTSSTSPGHFRWSRLSRPSTGHCTGGWSRLTNSANTLVEPAACVASPRRGGSSSWWSRMWSRRWSRGCG